MPHKPLPTPAALKVKPAAAYLSVSKPTIYRLVERGLLRPNRATRHLLFPISELERFLREGQTE
ncbi:MAG TPA: helix-turn-helix domain-containing protein [Candidatus Udaeobacter sp.]|jgi:excisionase family DNA binding protein|nr:helix-turn-helix domain-containing protein [Candidatus Udaeobacter sp.]